MTDLTLLDRLYCPLTGQPLQFDAAANQLTTADGSRQYPIVDGVPHLLLEEVETAPAVPELHQKLGTRFQYREHYQRDAEIFDYFQPPQDAATRHEARRLHQAIASEVPADARSLLDVGCGNAWVAGEFLRKGMEVYSLDITPINPRRAAERYPHDRHLPLVADVYALPFQAASLDVIIAAEIIEHVPDPATFINALLRALKPGGTLIVTTPYREKITYSLCVHCNRPTPQHAHLHSFDQSALAALPDEELVKNVKTEAFSSKVLNKLQTHRLLTYLPWPVWRLIDRLVNTLVDKPGRLMLILQKTS